MATGGTYSDHCAVHIVTNSGIYSDHCAVEGKVSERTAYFRYHSHYIVTLPHRTQFSSKVSDCTVQSVT